MVASSDGKLDMELVLDHHLESDWTETNIGMLERIYPRFDATMTIRGTI